ncbi:MAG TPA: hypothetical protein VJ599_05995 [Nitrososphaeraceae archaeon]|nr:hypothetical protein [Nitrososphaeraceae archaeon]
MDQFKGVAFELRGGEELQVKNNSHWVFKQKKKETPYYTDSTVYIF